MDEDKQIADELFSVKEQIPDGLYLKLMNKLGGKRKVPNVENVKVVKIAFECLSVEFCYDEIDEFINEASLITDEEYEEFEEEINRRISLHNVYYEKLFQVVDEGTQCSFDPCKFIDKNNYHISKYMLKTFIESYQNDDLYTPFLGKMKFRIKKIEVLS